jgi:DNA-directed RNA polymerase specialized sigma24 family protein
MEFPLAPEALYSSRMENERLARKQAADYAERLSRSLTPEQRKALAHVDAHYGCPYERAGERLAIIDPGGRIALRRLRQYLASEGGIDEVCTRLDQSKSTGLHGRPALDKLRKMK